MILNRFWWYKNAISPDLCDLILKETNWKKEYEAEVMRENKSLVIKKRKTKIVFQDPNLVAGCIIQNHIARANFEAGWNFNLGYLQKVQIGRYEDGGHYDWHIDLMNPDSQNMQRKLSAVVFLTDPSEYDGGILEFKNVQDALPKQEKGSLVVFPSFSMHRVTPVTKGKRHTAVGWMMGPAFK